MSLFGLYLLLAVSVFQVRAGDSVLLDDGDVVSAAVIRDGRNQPQIDVKLTPGGSQHLASATSGLPDQEIAIVIDGIVWAQPLIQAPLEFQILPIRGNFTDRQAADLVAKINAAARRR
jgi:preprotein translocase subunit SecD